ncbi:MAG: tripartite tricarboxylate transporter substrate-binding protein [Hyphomicrobiaceae bacterium]|nr:tripartite tricarboxylate transporter substrate binding protein BugD [Hyphomicrobiaceae bacterium]
MIIRRRSLFAGAFALASLGGFAPSHAQDVYPSRQITLILPAAAGGPTDTVSRLIAESMSRTLGQTVIVENMGGAGGTVGMARLAKSAPDGYTIGVWHIAQATAPAMYDSLKYDVLKDFDAIGRITDVPMTLTSKAALDIKTLPDLLAWIKAKKDEVTYGHAGVGTASHLCMLMLQKELGVTLKGVGYRGTGPAMNDLLGGQFDLMCDQTTNTTNQIKEGKIKGYAVTVTQRLAVLPDLPTLDQSGLKGFDVSAWHAVWAPKGLPKDVSDKLVAALKASLKDPKVIERFAALGTAPVPDEQATPAALMMKLQQEVPKWAETIKAFGIKGN